MAWVGELWRRLAALLRRNQMSTDLEEEMRLHMELRAEQHKESGIGPDEAHHAAQRKFGNALQLKENSREVWGWYWLETLAQDLRYALRMLRQSPVHSTITLSILALAIGANTAVFSLLDAWLIRPLPFQNPGRLVIVLGSELKRPTEPAIAVLYRDFAAWEKHSRSFESLAGMFWHSHLLTGSGEPEEIGGMVVTVGLFRTLGVAPELGRTFATDDLNGPPSVVLSHLIWQRRFAGSRAVVGRYITLNSVPHLVLGVMPAGFDLRMLEQPKGDDGVWTLVRPGDPDYGPESTMPIAAVGRLKPSFTTLAAQAELLALQNRVESKLPNGLKDFAPLITNLQADNTRGVRRTLFTLAAAVVSVLLIACTNLAALLMCRAVGRGRELNVRAALGCGRRRLVRQLLTENLLLCATGSAAGILLAYLSVQAFVAINPLGTLPPGSIAVNWRGLTFTVALTVLTTLLMGLAPALRASRVDLSETLKSTGSRNITGRRRRAQSLLLTTQIGLTVVVLVAACLLAETLIRITSQPLGVLPEGVAVMSISLPKQDFPALVDQHRFYSLLIEKLKPLPGLVHVAASTSDPIYGTPGDGELAIEGQPPSPGHAPHVELQVITPEYFSALSAPLLAGRGFSSEDTQTSEAVVIVNDRLMRTAFGGQNPIGKRIQIGRDKIWRKIIGVVGDIRFRRGGADRDSLEWVSRARTYVPYWQAAGDGFSPVNRRLYVYIHATRLPSGEELRRQIETLSRNVPITDYNPLTHLIANEQRQPRLRTTVLSGFALLALLLAALGIFGVGSQSVMERTNEIGIRMALGADPGQLRSMVIRQGLRIGGAGLALGIISSLAFLRGLSSLLYGVTPTEPVSMSVACAVLLAVCALASYLPARRASRIDPMEALKYE